MEKFVPYGKLSKKKRRELDARRRGSWGNVNPVTRRSENPKAYDRNKARKAACRQENMDFARQKSYLSGDHFFLRPVYSACSSCRRMA